MQNTGKSATATRMRKPFVGGIGGDSLLRTPFGARRAEMVGAGDLIVTRDNGLQPVRMVWKRKLTRTDMEAGAGRAPVRLRPRAVGPMMPTRDLLVASDHRIVVPGYRLEGEFKGKTCLVNAGEVAEGSDEAYIDRSTAGTDLYTFIFDTHQVFCASGLPVESFLPNESTMSALTGKLRKELVSLFPSLRKDPSSYQGPSIPTAPSGVRFAEPV